MSHKTFQMRCLVGAVLMLALWPAAVTLAAQEPAKKGGSGNSTPAQGIDTGKYVGTETCRGCHADRFKQVDSTQHFKTSAAKGRGDDWHGCESCHGAGAAHVEAGGDKSKIFRFGESSGTEASARCMECHQFNVEHMTFSRSAHARAGVGCTSCHSAHDSGNREFLLSGKQPEMCFNCHGENRAEFNKPFRHRVNEGLVRCSDCHNVHGSREKQLRTTASQDAVCFKCHSDKKGPFVFEHEPVKSEGCSVCHSPHGSNNPRLLNTSQMNALCLQCHSFSGSLAGSAGPHPQNSKSQACTLCHTQIHGSNIHEFFFK